MQIKQNEKRIGRVSLKKNIVKMGPKDGYCSATGTVYEPGSSNRCCVSFVLLRGEFMDLCTFWVSTQRKVAPLFTGGTGTNVHANKQPSTNQPQLDSYAEKKTPCCIYNPSLQFCAVRRLVQARYTAVAKDRTIACLWRCSTSINYSSFAAALFCSIRRRRSRLC